MKNKKVTMKKLIAAVMSVAVIATSIYFMPQTDASATDTTVQKQSYGAWKDTVPVNGSFEVGEEGMDVYGWSMTPMTLKREPVTVPSTIEAYLESYQLKTVVESNGNKAAELSKTGTGYMAMTSQTIDVDSNQDYRVSFDYKVTQLDINTDPTTGDLYTSNIDKYPVRFVIEEINENNEQTKKDDISMGDYSKQVHVDWNTYTTQFKTQSTTDKVIIHCWFGQGANVNATVLFDNIQLKKHDDYAVVNSSFDKTTYVSEGGRLEGVAGAAGWNLVGCAKGGTATGSSYSSYANQFSATVEDIDDRDNVVAVKHLEDQEAKFVLLESSFIPVEAGQMCDIAVDSKLVCRDAQGNEVLAGSRFKGMRIVLIPFDENYTALTRQYSGWYHDTKNSEGNNAWEKILYSAPNATPTNTKYIKICFYVGYNLDSDSTNAAAEDYNFTYYFDNIGLDVDDSSLGYTQYQGKNGGVEDTTITDQRASYGIRKVNGGTGYEDAVQLYATVEQRTTNGVLFARTFDVSPNVTYQVDLDMKIEGIEDSSTTIGADIALRYLDENKVLLETRALYDNDNNKKNTDSWEHKTYKSSTTTAPANAEYVEIVFLIGVNKTTTTNPDMRYTFANIAIEQGSNTNFWDAETGTYAKRALTDLLFKMLETDKEVSVKDLIDIKKAETFAIDMNISGRINEDDANIMRWKLTGVTKSSELRR